MMERPVDELNSYVVPGVFRVTNIEKWSAVRIQPPAARARPFRQLPAVPGILAAFSPECAVLADRAPIHSVLVIGRSEDCGYVIRDDKISKRHCRISRTAKECRIEDMESTNGTFLNGHPVVSSCFLTNGDVIRVGQSVLVFCDDISRLSAKCCRDLYGMEDPFHTPLVIETLREAAYSSRHEIHNLPVRTQRSVLQVIEDGQYSRVGETTPRTASARFIFASNDPSEYRGSRMICMRGFAVSTFRRSENDGRTSPPSSA